MTPRRLMLAILATVLILAATPVTAVMSPSGIDPRLRLDWEAAQGRDGRPVITGYIYNDYDRMAINVQLLAEALDASGRVVGRAIAFVSGNVPVLNRNYFSVPLKTSGASYRITVTSFEWRDCGI
jgi:hypothetical protein